MHVALCSHVHVCSRTTVYVERSENSLQQSVLSSHHVGSEDPAQVVRLGSKLSHLDRFRFFGRIGQLERVYFDYYAIQCPLISYLQLSSELSLLWESFTNWREQ